MNKDTKYSQLLEARRIGINETDVDNSTDVFELLRWQIEISKDIANISAQLEKTKLPDSEFDVAWAQRAAASKELLIIFVQKINLRVQELKAAKSQSLSEAFVSVCRDKLDFSVYNEIFKLAKEKVK